MTDEEFEDARALAGMQMLWESSEAAGAAVGFPGSTIYAYDLQPPLKVLAPSLDPPGYQPHLPPPRVTLDPAPDGMVWVSFTDDYYAGIGWYRMRSIDRIYGHEAERARLVTVETIERWEAAQAAYLDAQDEAEKLLRGA